MSNETLSEIKNDMQQDADDFKQATRKSLQDLQQQMLSDWMPQQPSDPRRAPEDLTDAIGAGSEPKPRDTDQPNPAAQPDNPSPAAEPLSDEFDQSIGASGNNYPTTRTIAQHPPQSEFWRLVNRYVDISDLPDFVISDLADQSPSREAGQHQGRNGAVRQSGDLDRNHQPAEKADGQAKRRDSGSDQADRTGTTDPRAATGTSREAAPAGAGTLEADRTRTASQTSPAREIGRGASRTSTQTSGREGGTGKIGTGASGASQGRTPKEMPEQPRQSIQLPIATGAKDEATISVFQRLRDKFAEGISGLIGGFHKLTARTRSVLESLRADESQQRAWASEAKRAADRNREAEQYHQAVHTGTRELECAAQGANQFSQAARRLDAAIRGYDPLAETTDRIADQFSAIAKQRTQERLDREAKRARQAASTADQGQDRRDRQPTEETGGMRELEEMVQRRRQDARADEAGILGGQQAIIEQQRDIDDTKQTFALYHQQSTRTNEYIAWLDQQIQIGVQHQIEAQATKPAQESKPKPQESVEYSSPSPFD